MDAADINALLERVQSKAMSAEALSPEILRPIPRRAFERFSPSTGTSTPSTPAQDANADADAAADGAPARSMARPTPSRERSLLNLTSSALFGIYSPTADNDGPPTPWSQPSSIPNTPRRMTEENGAAGPPQLNHPRIHQALAGYGAQSHGPAGLSQIVMSLTLRTLLLFGFGVAYGVIITHLHDNQKWAPVEIVGFHSFDWSHSLLWGVAGVALGSLLPWIDLLWEDRLAGGAGSKNTASTEKASKDTRTNETNRDGDSRAVSPSSGAFGADWNAVVRSVGAFVGIAFAIRKLPWQSTLQVSLTLALVNPVLWYLIDRSKAGFLLSAFVGVTGTAVLLGTNPEIVPAPTTNTHPIPSASSILSAAANGSSISTSSLPSPSSVISAAKGPVAGFITPESIGVGTWIASVLFCSCVCFGNIGRRLALKSGRAS